MDDSTARIRALNDALRMNGRGGTLLMTSGVAALPLDMRAAIFDAVRTFDDFTPDNDPWGEHDFGAFVVAGQRFFFKIDYCDLERRYCSPDPSDPARTHRLLTIMLAAEY